MDEESKLCTDYCASFAAGNFGKSRVAARMLLPMRSVCVLSPETVQF